MKTIDEIKTDLWDSKIFALERQIRSAVENGKKYVVTALEFDVEKNALKSGYNTSHVIYDEDGELVELYDEHKYPIVFLKISWK